MTSHRTLRTSASGPAVRPLRSLARPGRTVLAWTAVLITLAAGAPAGAQVVVHDPLNYTSLIAQAQTALNQLEQLRTQVGQAQRLYDGFNSISNVNSLATALATPALRGFMPDIDAYAAAAHGDFSGLGQIGELATTIRQASRLFTAPAGDALGQELETSGDRIARDLALGQQTAAAGARRLTGLQQLTSALDTAADARAVMDLQARIAAETAMIANDQMRLQGLAMAQDAETRQQAQRDRERAAAQSAERLQLFERAFR